MEYVVIFLLIIVIVLLSYGLWKSLGVVAEYEESAEKLHNSLLDLATSISDVLDKEIYANDPVIINFVENLKSIEGYIHEINPDLNFNELGEEINESAEYR
tara:strand:+ start:82 stop:384 length:303 start_codon:yes stop_codon:yes gene_type:complete